jgi:hypothetical protein
VAESLSPFDRRTLAWLVAVAAGSLLLAVYATLIVPPEADVKSAQADSFSRSAIGHNAFVELLRASGVPLLVSRHNSAARASGSGVLVLLEPRVDEPGRAARLESMVQNARVSLVVLPKWQGEEDPNRPGWVKSVTLIREEEATAVLRALDIKADVRRSGGGPSDGCGAFNVELTSPQLLRSTSLVPLVTCGDGILLGEMLREDGRVLVLSDPDVLANHGLGRGDNAAVALDVVKRAGSPPKVLIVDEALHGHESVSSLWNDLFRMPLVLAVFHAALAVGVLLWSGIPRFGAPVPVRHGLESGKEVLIDNTAALLHQGGHAPHVLRCYLDAAIDDALAALHTPAHLPRSERLAHLARRPGQTVDIRGVEDAVRGMQGGRVGDGVILSLAQKIHLWKEELIRGPLKRPGR